MNAQNELAFQEPVVSASDQGDGMARIAKGDFNNDGKMDVVSGSSRIYTQSSDGQFESSILPEPLHGFDVGVADFNGDGNLDIVVQNYGREWRYWEGKGDGTFNTPKKYMIKQFGLATGLDIGDVNGDGKLDVALTSHTDCDLYLYVGDGVGNFEFDKAVWAGAERPWKCSGGYDIHITDFDNDGINDFVAVFENYGNPFIGEIGTLVSFVKGLGDGEYAEFKSLVEDNRCAAPQDAQISDFNHDGYLDLLVANSGANKSCGDAAIGGVVFYPGLGNGLVDESNRKMITTTLSSHYMLVEDLDKDGNEDIVVTTPWNTSVPGQSFSGIEVLRGRGDGSFYSAYTHTINGYGVVSADLNNDNKTDIIAVGNHPSKDTKQFSIASFMQESKKEELPDITIRSAEYTASKKEIAFTLCNFAEQKKVFPPPPTTYQPFEVSLKIMRNKRTIQTSVAKYNSVPKGGACFTGYMKDVKTANDGLYTLEIVADSKEQVKELDETNNLHVTIIASKLPLKIVPSITKAPVRKITLPTKKYSPSRSIFRWW